VGLEGFLGLYVEPEDLLYFQPGCEVVVDDGRLTVAATRRGKKGHEVRFAEVQDRAGAERIRNLDVYAPQRRDLSEGEFWPSQLVGLDVRPHGGEVVDVIHGPAQSRLVIERSGLRFEVPFVEALVPVVDLQSGHVEVLEIEGLTES
jgi:16S rRNA processing protein RimM